MQVRSVIYASYPRDMALLAFMARSLLYCGTCGLTLLAKGAETKTSSSLVTSSLQILIVACGMLLYMLCMLLFEAVKEAYAYRHVHELPSPVGSLDDLSFPELECAPDKATPRAHTQPCVMHEVDLENCSSAHSERIEKLEKQSDLHSFKTNMEAVSRADSVTPPPPPSNARTSKGAGQARAPPDADTAVEWKFQSSEELYMYIVRVHLIGFVLWGTVMALDFAHPAMLTFFTTGLFVGVMLCHHDREQSYETTQRRVLSLCGIFLYSVMFTCVVSVCFMHQNIDFTDLPGDVYYVVVSIVGFVWGVQYPHYRIVATAHNGFITTALMSLPILFMLTTLDDVNLLIHRSGISALYVLIVEPMLKFVNVYVLILSVQAQRAMEVSVILVSVICVQVMYQAFYTENSVSVQSATVVGIAVALLLLMHLVRLSLP